jgi:hypothetical protein
VKSTKARARRGAKADSAARNEAEIAHSARNAAEATKPLVRRGQTSSDAAVPAPLRNVQIVRTVQIAPAALPAVARPVEVPPEAARPVVVLSSQDSASRQAALNAEAISEKTGRPGPQAEISVATDRLVIARPARAKAQPASGPLRAAVVPPSARVVDRRVLASVRRDPSPPALTRIDQIPARTVARLARGAVPSAPIVLPVQVALLAVHPAPVAHPVQIARSASRSEIGLPAAPVAPIVVRPAAKASPARRATALSSGHILRRAIPGRPAPPGRAMFRPAWTPVVSVRSAHSRRALVHQDRRGRIAIRAPSALAVSVPVVPVGSANPAAGPARLVSPVLSARPVLSTSRASASLPPIGPRPAAIVQSAAQVLRALARRALPSVQAGVLLVPQGTETQLWARASPAVSEKRAVQASPLANHVPQARAAPPQRLAPASPAAPAASEHRVRVVAAVHPRRVGLNRGAISSPVENAPAVNALAVHALAVLSRQSASRAANPVKETKVR